MDSKDAYEFIMAHVVTDVGRFYGSAEHLSIGAGLLFSGVRYPLYDETTDIFMTVRGTVYILTHECDVDPNNVRPFNDDVLICPVIPLGDFVLLYEARFNPVGLKPFLFNLAQRRVSRLMYFPPIAQHLEYGGVLYFNQISSTKLQAFAMDEVQRIRAVSAFGMFEVDKMLENHLLRAKEEGLSFTVH